MVPEERFMQRAIDIAKESASEGDYAIGAVIVRNGEILSEGKTLLKRENDPTVHAEVVAIRNACNTINSRFLDGCVLYTTHEPCPMCASAAIWAKVSGIVFGAYIEDADVHADSKFTWRQIYISCSDVIAKGTPKPKLFPGFMRERCVELFELSR